MLLQLRCCKQTSGLLRPCLHIAVVCGGDAGAYEGAAYTRLSCMTPRFRQPFLIIYIYILRNFWPCPFAQLLTCLNQTLVPAKDLNRKTLDIHVRTPACVCLRQHLWQHKLRQECMLEWLLSSKYMNLNLLHLGLPISASILQIVLGIFCSYC